MKPYYKDRDELRDKIIAMRKELNELTKQWHKWDEENEEVYDEESEER